MKYEEIMQGVRADRIEAAIEAAAELFLENGIDQAKMTDIAERSQLGVASLYRYFGTKQKFVIRVASRIWLTMEEMHKDVYASDHYHSCTGIGQIEELMKIFHVLLEQNPRFLRFVAEFDAYVMREHIPTSELSEYESSVHGSWELMKKAVAKGHADGTIRNDIDINHFYYAATHSLMALSQKLAAGRILESDAVDGGCEELLTLIKIFVSYLRVN